MLDAPIIFDNILIYFACFTGLLTTIAFIRSSNILITILLNASFSIFTVIMYLALDAPDVAMTEAAVSLLTSIFAIYTIKATYEGEYSFKEKANIFALILCLTLAICLMYAGFDLPIFGEKKDSIQYIDSTVNDIGIPSLVTAILASYRGYDTLFETIVIVIAGMSVLMISNVKPSNIKDKPDLLNLTTTRFMISFILLFAFYLQFHSEISPGGGFQAGSIIALALIVYDMAIGINIALNRLKFAAILGTAIYFITGLLGLFSKFEFLNYNVLYKNHLVAQKIGITLVEIGVGISVASIMLLIYFCLSRHAAHKS